MPRHRQIRYHIGQVHKEPVITQKKVELNTNSSRLNRRGPFPAPSATSARKLFGDTRAMVSGISARAARSRIALRLRNRLKFPPASCPRCDVISPGPPPPAVASRTSPQSTDLLLKSCRPPHAVKLEERTLQYQRLESLLASHRRDTSRHRDGSNGGVTICQPPSTIRQALLAKARRLFFVE